MTHEQFEQAMDQDGRRCTEADVCEYRRICGILPQWEPGDFQFCGPHSYHSMRLALKASKPLRILEIGFNLGHSSLWWLDNSTAHVTSTDIRTDGKVARAAKILEQFYPTRFQFLPRNTVINSTFDLAFIDGSHEFDDVLFDIQWCRHLKIPHLLMDDWLSIYGGVQRAVFSSGLKILWTSGNQALLDNTDSFTEIHV